MQVCLTLPCGETGSNQSHEGEESEVSEAGDEAHEHANSTPDETPIPAEPGGGSPNKLKMHSELANITTALCFMSIAAHCGGTCVCNARHEKAHKDSLDASVGMPAHMLALLSIILMLNAMRPANIASSVHMRQC